MANEIGFTDHERLISPIEHAEDFDSESSLRPQRLCDYVGQEKIKENLSIYLEAAKMRGEALDHLLLSDLLVLAKQPLQASLPTKWG